MRQLKTVTLLKTINRTGAPVGATSLSEVLNIPSATIGRHLKKLEDEGYLVSVGNKGRKLTEEGQKYLEKLDTLEEQEKTAKKLIDLSTDDTLEHIIEVLKVRSLIEPYMAMEACTNATEQQLEAIELASMEHLIELRKGNLGNEYDLKLHLLIAEASGNTTIYHILKLLLMENETYTVFSKISSLMERTQITRHDKIVKAISDRDAEAAYAAMEAHLKCLMENAKEYGTVQSELNSFE